MRGIAAEAATGSAGDMDVAASSHKLFVIPHQRRDGFWASIRGHALDLADPSSGRGLAPTPDDLFVASLASELAWSARSLLRAAGRPDDVSVTATWRTPADPARSGSVDLTVTVSREADGMRAALAAAFERILASRSLAEPTVRVSVDGAGG